VSDDDNDGGNGCPLYHRHFSSDEKGEELMKFTLLNECTKNVTRERKNIRASLV
jgi:hypothetical protein